MSDFCGSHYFILLQCRLDRSLAVKDEIFCLFEGVLDNLGGLRQQYGLAKSANEVVLVIKAYKALCDRRLTLQTMLLDTLKGISPLWYSISPPRHCMWLLISLVWGITADGFVAFADDAELLKGCFFSTVIGELRSFENPKNKITAVPAKDEEI
ncbi:hypothetical protein HHK36_009176 [Tetracentron sinense]|uniref:DUF3700 domain-containing protein n=1 Tax=Tetracentron sinense TaxID=13715 RepID=A0A834ZB95_TETSI|nr:hypothetical protein HHK36_009176 [Tetracentron sinense]